MIADLLFREFPAFDEGQKSKTKAMLVSTHGAGAPGRAAVARRPPAARAAAKRRRGGRRKQALLADGYEALIAAIYLDGGIEHVRAFIAREFAPLIDDVRRDGLAGQDYKSSLQEYLQSHDRPLPEYRLAGTAGPDHRKRFHVDVVVRRRARSRGGGPSKKEAEQEAARLALERLRQAEKR